MATTFVIDEHKSPSTAPRTPQVKISADADRQR